MLSKISIESQYGGNFHGVVITRLMRLCLEILQKQRYQAANAYIKVLQSIQRTGFSFSRGPTTPVQLLVDGENYVCIQQGSHHRLAALDFLVTNQFDDLTNTIERNENGDPLVPCEITLILNREDLEYLDQVGNHDGQFSKNDAYLWFDLALSLIGKEGVNRITEEDIILVQSVKFYECT